VTGRRSTPYVLMLPAVGWLGVFFVVPTITLVSTSLQEGSLEEGYVFTGNVGIYAEVLQDYTPQFLRSFVYAGIATVAALLIAYPLAYTIAVKGGRYRNLLLVLVVAPFFTSFLVRTLAWKIILADDGPVADVLRALHLLDLTDGRLLATPIAVVCGLTYNFLPFMTLPLYASLERLDNRLLEAANDLYASPFTTFRRVTFPLSLPGVVGGTLLTFIPAAGDYVNVEFLGTPQTSMIGNVIQSRFLVVGDYPAAAALSVILMVTIVVMVMVYVRRAGTEDLV
jgi:spermidine/putrescine transport system permease protein